MSLLTYCMNILMSLMMLSMVFVMVTMSMASAERIAEVLNEKSRSGQSGSIRTLRSSQTEALTLTMYTFRYSAKTKEYPYLDDINLSITSGETIGIIGGTGSAKIQLWST